MHETISKMYQLSLDINVPTCYIVLAIKLSVNKNLPSRQIKHSHTKAKPYIIYQSDKKWNFWGFPLECRRWKALWWISNNHLPCFVLWCLCLYNCTSYYAWLRGPNRKLSIMFKWFVRIINIYKMILFTSL